METGSRTSTRIRLSRGSRHPRIVAGLKQQAVWRSKFIRLAAPDGHVRPRPQPPAPATRPSHPAAEPHARRSLRSSPPVNHRSASPFAPFGPPRLHQDPEVLQVPTTDRSVLFHPTLVDLLLPVVIRRFALLDIAVVRSSSCLLLSAILFLFQSWPGNLSSPFAESLWPAVLRL
ncbi:hypothetical protein VTN02DRAFT_5027 [Thermoascus thermophilus]